jgi:replicative DNA helicase
MTSAPTLYNLEAEQALIGCLLYDPGLIDQIDLTPDDLYVDRHKRVFKAVRGLTTQGIEPDLVTLTDLFEREGVLSEMGGPAFLTGLLLDIPSTQHVQSYARVVRDYARRRKLLSVASELARAAHDIDAAIDAPITAAIDSLGTTAAVTRGARPMSDWVDELRRDVFDRIDNPRDVWGIPTGFLDVDALIGGIQPSEVLYLAGEPGVGKSKLMLNMAQNMAKAGFPGAVFSLEMDGLAMTRRAVSVAGKVPTRLLKSGKLEGADYEAYDKGAIEVWHLPMYLSDDPTLTLVGLRAELSRLRARFGIRWFALDYLLLLSGFDNDSETDRSTKLSRGTRRIARDLDLAALTVNSVTKEGMGKNGAPVSKDLRGSGQVVHDADLIGFLIRDEAQDRQNIVKLVFTKTRDVDGGTRTIHLYARPEYPAFENMQPYSLNGNNNGRIR